MKKKVVQTQAKKPLKGMQFFWEAAQLVVPQNECLQLFSLKAPIVLHCCEPETEI